MKIGKSMALMGLGIGAGVASTIAYQKYRKPLMKKMEKVVDQTIEKANNKLEHMM